MHDGPVRPMKAASATELPTDGSRWAYEVKWDGMRVVVRLAEGRLRAWSANGADASGRFPELAGLVDHLGDREPVVLDGEVVALDPATGRPDFGRLQPRMHASGDAIARAAAEVPVSYAVFDLLEVDGTSLLERPYSERRALLETVVHDGPGWFVPAAHDDGAALLAAVDAQGLEGVVAKRRDSRYEPGRRSPAWVKVKVRRQQELVVGGWLPGTGARAPTFGALLLGYHDPPSTDGGPAGPLRFAGRVGTGFSDRVLRELRTRLDALAAPSCPFEPAPPREVRRHGHWVRPELVVEVAHAEWTADGVLRHPSFLGERTDVLAAEVGRTP